MPIEGETVACYSSCPYESCHTPEKLNKQLLFSDELKNASAFLLGKQKKSTNCDDDDLWIKSRGWRSVQMKSHQ